MNYQHLYHAGSHTDVFKHLILLALLDNMKLKEKPFCYIDTHAGYGEYDLTQVHIQEWRHGIGLLHQSHSVHPLLKLYHQLTLDLTHFPGSPLIARDALREQDEMILAELSDDAYYSLKQLFHHDKQVHIHHLDAYHLPKAILPPAIRRGVVLIDPPYEDPHEFEKLPLFLKEALARFTTATYALWYPIKSRTPVDRLFSTLKKTLSQEMLVIEFCPWPDDVPIRLNGSGMIIVNPSWKFNETLHPLLNELIQQLKQHGKASWRSFTL